MGNNRNFDLLVQIFSFFDQNFHLRRKIFNQNFDFWPNFQLFWPKFPFLTKISILTEMSIFDQNFDFWPTISIWDRKMSPYSNSLFFKLWPWRLAICKIKSQNFQKKIKKKVIFRKNLLKNESWCNWSNWNARWWKRGFRKVRRFFYFVYFFCFCKTIRSSRVTKQRWQASNSFFCHFWSHTYILPIRELINYSY